MFVTIQIFNQSKKFKFNLNIIFSVFILLERLRGYSFSQNKVIRFCIVETPSHLVYILEFIDELIPPSSSSRPVSLSKNLVRDEVGTQNERENERELCLQFCLTLLLFFSDIYYIEGDFVHTVSVFFSTFSLSLNQLDRTHRFLTLGCPPHPLFHRFVFFFFQLSSIILSFSLLLEASLFCCPGEKSTNTQSDQRYTEEKKNDKTCVT